MLKRAFLSAVLMAITFPIGCGKQAPPKSPETKAQAIEVEKARRQREMNDIRDSRN